MTEPIKLTTQLYRIIFNRDGGGRIFLDFGAESLKSIQKLQDLNSEGDVNLATVFVPYEGLDFDIGPRNNG